jgi:hypothetical protein
MDLELLKVILQALSSLAIAGGLIFAAVQFRQAQRAARVLNFTKMVEMQMQLRRMRVDDPSLASIYRHDVQALNSDRDIREYFFNLMQVSVFEVVWYAHREGQVDDDYFDSWSTRMRDIAAEASFRKAMTSPNMKILHDDFARHMAEMLRSVPEQGVA